MITIGSTAAAEISWECDCWLLLTKSTQRRSSRRLFARMCVRGRRPGDSDFYAEHSDELQIANDWQTTIHLMISPPTLIKVKDFRLAWQLPNILCDIRLAAGGNFSGLHCSASEAPPTRNIHKRFRKIAAESEASLLHFTRFSHAAFEYTLRKYEICASEARTNKVAWRSWTLLPLPCHSRRRFWWSDFHRRLSANYALVHRTKLF